MQSINIQQPVKSPSYKLMILKLISKCFSFSKNKFRYFHLL